MVSIFEFEESSGVFSICNASFSSWNLNFVAQVDDMRKRGKSAKGADKHLGTELHTLGFELATSRLVDMTGAI